MKSPMPEERTDEMQALIAEMRDSAVRVNAGPAAFVFDTCADELEKLLAASPASGAPTAETFCSRYGTHGWTKTPSKGDPCDCGGVRYAETDDGVFGEIGED